jgi:hypothetical protein
VRGREREIYPEKYRHKNKNKKKVLAVEVDLMIHIYYSWKELKLIKCLNNESTNLFPPFILFLV